MRAILLHGMGRTPLSMLILKKRLAEQGLHSTLFGYSATFESFEHCVQRLIKRVQQIMGGDPYILIGHSLGGVIIRAALPYLAFHLPQACFLLASPSMVCKAVRYFSKNPIFRLLTGEMSQLLADEAFMKSLPIPMIPTKIYAGTAGPQKTWFPLGDEENDGVLTVSEVQGTLIFPVTRIPHLHTWIMNSREIADDIIKTIKQV
ncbi:MAG: alpha/beta fold hydrolase [Pseudomonadota bacterium]